MQVNCYYDYTCPYSYRAFVWLEAVRAAGPHLEVFWRTFSLKELNREPGSPSAFADAENASVSVLALALAQAAREVDFDRYHRAVFSAMHAEGRRLGQDDLLRFAAEAGVDGEGLDWSRWLGALATEHREGAARFGVFGTPTLVLDGEAVVFLKLAEPPATGEAIPLWQSLCTLARCHPELLEIKRPA